MATQPGGTVQDGAQLSPRPVVKLQDALGNDVRTGGRSITAALVSSPSGATLNGDATRTTDGNGSASFNNLSIIGPVGSYTLRFTSGSLTAATSTAISLTVGPVNAGKSTVNANPNSIPVGQNSTITVTALDVGGNPIQGASVVLAATGSNNTLGQPGATNGSGVATGSFSSTALGTHTITAKINGVEVTTKPVITVTPGPVSASESSVGAAPNAIPAGGGPSTVTVTARDAAGNAISGASVSLLVSGGGNGERTGRNQCERRDDRQLHVHGGRRPRDHRQDQWRDDR